MSVQQLIEHIEALSVEDYADLVNFLNRAHDQDLAEAIGRDEELDAGAVPALTHEEVFSAARRALAGSSIMGRQCAS